MQDSLKLDWLEGGSSRLVRLAGKAELVGKLCATWHPPAKQRRTPGPKENKSLENKWEKEEEMEERDKKNRTRVKET